MYLRFTCLFSVLGTERLGSLVTPCALWGCYGEGERAAHCYETLVAQQNNLHCFLLAEVTLT